jgi:hypothetical protein
MRKKTDPDDELIGAWNGAISVLLANSETPSLFLGGVGFVYLLSKLIIPFEHT